MTLQNSNLISHLIFDQPLKPYLTNRHKMISIFRQLSFSVACSAAFLPAHAIAQITPDVSIPASVEQLEEITTVKQETY
jgi:hypothetical protein